MSAYVEFTCLYTAQKQKKAKTWQDGFLRLYTKNSKVVLYDIKKSSLDSTFHKGAPLGAGDELEMDRHLITIEDCIGLIANDGPPEPAPVVNVAQRYPVQHASVARPPLVASPSPLSTIHSTAMSPNQMLSAPLVLPASSVVTVATTATVVQGPAGSAVAAASSTSSNSSPLPLPAAAPGISEANPPITSRSSSSGGLERVKRKKWRAPFNDPALSVQGHAHPTMPQHDSLDDFMAVDDATGHLESSNSMAPRVARPGPVDVMPAMTATFATATSAASTHHAAGNVVPTYGQSLSPLPANVRPPANQNSPTPQPPKRRRIGLGPGSSAVSVSSKKDGALTLSQRPPLTSLEFPSAARCNFLAGGSSVNGGGGKGNFNHQNLALKRFQGLGPRFNTPAQYKEGMTGLILEHLQILVTQLAIKFWNTKTAFKQSSNNAGGGESFDNAFRSRGIAMYSGCSLRRRGDSGAYAGYPLFAEKASSSRGLDMMPAQSLPGNNDQEQGAVITVSNKEHHANYSKDDIWVVALNATFDPQSTFFARSVFYGPSGGEIDLTCISSKDSSIARSLFPNVTSVYAIRIMNAMSEFLMLDNLQETLSKSPILPTILSYTPPEQMRASKGPVFKPPTKVADRSGCIVLTEDDQVDVEQEVQTTIERFRLNEDQATVLRNFALQVIRAPGWATDKAVADMPPLMLVHGIFGTGKSFLIAVLIVFLDHILTISRPLPQDERSYKVLITAMTNVAVDRVLTALLDLGYDKLVRVGSIKKVARRVLPFTAQSNATTKASEEIKELQSILNEDSLLHSERRYVRQALKRFQKYKNRGIAEDAHVVGTTCIASTFEILEGVAFPIVIVDEASQLLEPMSMIPICRTGGEKVVLVGDPLQLSPPIHTNADVIAASKGLSRTLFDRALEMGIKPMMLRTQYRCHPRIAEVCNALFYSNVLKTGVTPAQRTPLIEGIPTLAFLHLAGGAELQQSKNKSYTNPVEAKLIVQLVGELLRLNIPANEIGVISPYKNQADAIAEGLQQLQQQHYELKSGGVQISTVDAFQGSEKNVILLSTVRTNAIGFIDHHQRVNVALSRSKRHLLIVGNAKLLESNDIWGKVINNHCKSSRDGIVPSDEFVRMLRTLEPLPVLEASAEDQVETDESEADEEDDRLENGLYRSHRLRQQRFGSDSEDQATTEEDEEDEGGNHRSRGRLASSNSRNAPTEKAVAEPKLYSRYMADSEEDEDDGATDEEGGGGRVTDHELQQHRQRVQQRALGLRSAGGSSSSSSNWDGSGGGSNSPPPSRSASLSASSSSPRATLTGSAIFPPQPQQLPSRVLLGPAVDNQAAPSWFAQARAAAVSRTMETTRGASRPTVALEPSSSSLSSPPVVSRSGLQPVRVAHVVRDQAPPPSFPLPMPKATPAQTQRPSPPPPQSTTAAAASSGVATSRLSGFAFDKKSFQQRQHQEHPSNQAYQHAVDASSLSAAVVHEEDGAMDVQKQKQMQPPAQNTSFPLPPPIPATAAIAVGEGSVADGMDEEEEREIWAMSEDSGMEEEEEHERDHQLLESEHKSKHKQWEQGREEEHKREQGEDPQPRQHKQVSPSPQPHRPQHSGERDMVESELSHGLKRVLSDMAEGEEQQQEVALPEEGVVAGEETADKNVGKDDPGPMHSLPTEPHSACADDNGPEEHGHQRGHAPPLVLTNTQSTPSQHLEDLELSGSQWSVGFGTPMSKGDGGGGGATVTEEATPTRSTPSRQQQKAGDDVKRSSEMAMMMEEEDESLACLEVGDLDEDDIVFENE